MDGDLKVRPWTVYGIVVLLVALSIWVIVTPERILSGLVLALAGFGLTYALWLGRTWAFTTTFMLATLAAGCLVAVLFFQLFLYEVGLDARLLSALAFCMVLAALVVHPRSKRFASLPSLSGSSVMGQEQ